MLDGLDIRLFLPLVTAVVAFVFWVVRRFIEDRQAAQDRAARHDNLVRALYAEIDFNTRDMELFLERSPGADLIAEALQKNPELIPHITDARHTEIYRNGIGDLTVISDRALRRSVEFYGLLEKIRVQIEAINFPSFRTLSSGGKVNAVDVIRRTATLAEAEGQVLLTLFERDYERLRLKRLDREDISIVPQDQTDKRQ